MMKNALLIFFLPISLLTYSQENKLQIFAIDVEELSTPLAAISQKFDVKKYQLTEVNLAIDLRQESLRKKNTMYIETSQNNTVLKNYTLSLSKPKEVSGFTISGNNMNLRNKNKGSIKNTAYTDAGLYTNFLYYRNNINRNSTSRF